MAFQKGHNHGKGGKREGAGRKPDEVVREIKTLARAYDVEALERLAFWMRSDNAKASVSASIALLDRGHGKPEQSIAATPELARLILNFPKESNA